MDRRRGGLGLASQWSSPFLVSRQERCLCVCARVCARAGPTELGSRPWAPVFYPLRNFAVIFLS